MQKKVILVVILLGLFVLGFVFCYVHQNEQAKIETYNSAVSDILAEEYTNAKTKLEFLAKETYKDSDELYSFCEGMEFYLIGGDSLNAAKICLEKSTFYEQTALYRDIFSERKQMVLDAKAAYDKEQEYIRQEQERIRQEEKRIRLEQEAERARKEEEALLRKIHEGLPYVGMSEKYIDATSLGMHSDSYTNTNIENNKRVQGSGYYWKKDGYQIFFVFCKYGKVVDAVDQRGSIEIQKQRKEEKKKEEQKKKTQSGDPYHAKDYGYASDFYEDYYDEFYDAIDAEDYWEEHYYE